MTKILVVDPGRSLRDLLRHILSSAGHSVVEDKDGRSAFDKAVYERPDIILLEVVMPMFDVFQVLKRLKEDPATSSIPVIVLTSMPPAKGEATAIALGASHYVTKPWQPGALERMMKVVLHNAAPVAAQSTNGHTVVEAPEAPKLIRSGYRPLDEKLGGGVRLGTFSLIEGEPLAGKSVLCQQLAYESMEDGHRLAYFTSEYDDEGLLRQLGFLGRDAAAYFRNGRVRMHELQGSAPGWDPRQCEDPDRLLALLAVEMEDLPTKCKIIVVDPLTNLARHSRDTVVLNFFATCRRLCDSYDKTIVLSTRSYAFDNKTLGRLHDLCDAHLNLRTEEVGLKKVNMLEVRKLNNAELSRGNLGTFQVAPGVGLKQVPGLKVRV